MPRPGEVRSPSYQTGDALPKGAASQVEAMGAMPTLAASMFSAAGRGEEEPPESFTDPAMQFLFSTTDRPDEPVTAGVPFGEGPDFTSRGYESHDAFKRRVVLGMIQKPGAPSEVVALAKRVARGE